jgi:hypothetical protein
MNATSWGKASLLTNLILSFLLAGAGLAVYGNSLDWAGTRSAPTGEAQPGELKSARAEMEKLQKVAGVAMARYEESAKTLSRLEARPPKDEGLYAQVFAELEGKAGKPGKVQVLTSRTIRGQTDLDEDGLVVLDPKDAKPPIESHQSYLEQLAQVEKEIQAEQAALRDVIRQEEERTLEINGVAGKQKGLRDLLTEVIGARQNALAELERLRPLRYNREVEAEILADRQHVLQARLQELKNVGLTSRLP